jgi:hypothetical protein
MNIATKTWIILAIVTFVLLYSALIISKEPPPKL